LISEELAAYQCFIAIGTIFIVLAIWLATFRAF
jgi:hypothetical protein